MPADGPSQIAVLQMLSQQPVRNSGIKFLTSDFLHCLNTFYYFFFPLHTISQQTGKPIRNRRLVHLVSASEILNVSNYHLAKSPERVMSAKYIFKKQQQHINNGVMWALLQRQMKNNFLKYHIYLVSSCSS